jgi:hypothetical protein
MSVEEAKVECVKIELNGGQSVVGGKNDGR